MTAVSTVVDVILKPCPLCGGEAVMESVTTAMERVPRYRVRCKACQLGSLRWDFWSITVAANWWNRRERENDG